MGGTPQNELIHEYTYRYSSFFSLFCVSTDMDPERPLVLFHFLFAFLF